MDLLEAGYNRIYLPDQGAAEKSRALELFGKYINEIELFNEAYGLVKVQDRGELIIKHILDSLAPLNVILRQLETAVDPREKISALKIVDVGSGAGFPGIPLAISLPRTDFTLVERMGRRAGFLRNCAAILGLSNIQVEEAEMEKAAPGRFDIAVFRAFRPLEPDILRGLLRLLRPRGFLAAWKGRLEHSQKEMENAEKFIPDINWKIIPLSVPFLEEERCLTIISQPPAEPCGRNT